MDPSMTNLLPGVVPDCQHSATLTNEVGIITPRDSAKSHKSTYCSQSSRPLSSVVYKDSGNLSSARDVGSSSDAYPCLIRIQAQGLPTVWVDQATGEMKVELDAREKSQDVSVLHADLNGKFHLQVE
ncbi:unnamed protein product [Protopolystoma xenopodis]|uniref:Uncharacterized protein n=1 Tax=Protopolystoma xenopodis TaxID=117903 RepID=A0A448WB04_9PLAT|nr:unnamed protein product [Protopolystoma xenopodis]